jgi:hypothetical protein
MRRLLLAAWFLVLVAPCEAAITFVASRTALLTTADTQISLVAPTGLATNDVMVAFFATNTSSQPNVKTPPAGWTRWLESNDGQILGVAVYYKVATGGDVGGSTSYTWLFDNPSRAAGGVMAFRGVNTTTPVVAGSPSVNASSTSYLAPSITPGVANTMLVLLYGTENGNATTLSTPASTTKAYSVVTGAGAGGNLLAGYYGSLSGSGATGAKSVTSSSSAINTISIGVALALQPAGVATISAFDVTYSAYGLYCLNQSVTVSPVDAGGNPVPSYSGTMNLSTTSNRGTWTLTSGAGSFSDATPDDGKASYTFSGSESSATFALSYRAGAATITVNAQQASPTVINDDGTQGTLTFSPSGFTVTSSPFSNPAGGVPAFASPKTAGSSFNVYITAYGQNPTDATCGIITTYTGAKNLKFWSGYVNPATGTIRASINGSSIATAEGSSAAQGVTFTSGQATATAQYKDAGSLTLSMKDDTTGNPLLPTGIRGSTGTIVSVPANFVVSNIKRSSDAFANPAASTATGTVFIGAGQSFTATVTAVEAGGATTPNFGRESSPESVRFSATLVLPASGNNPAVSGTAGTFTNGVGTGTAFSWPEVGIVQLVPRVSDGNYLGAGDVLGTATGNVGRFVPNGFGVSPNTPVFATACVAGSYTYLGQPFIYSVAPVLTLTAQALGGATTQNYTGSLMRLANSSLTGRSYTPTPASPGLDSSGLPATSVDPAITDLGNGQVTLTFSAGTGLRFSRTTPVSPFDANIRLAINVIDLDGAAAANPVTVGAGGGIAFSTGATQRFGRLALRNRVGSELLDLPVPLQAEYYLDSSRGFTQNLADSCTVAPALAFGGWLSHLGAGETCVRDSGSPGVSGQGCAVAAGSGRYRATAVTGDFNLVLAAPGAGNDGAVTVTATAPAWLRYAWDSGSGLASDPAAIATFGQFPGPATRVFQREIY